MNELMAITAIAAICFAIAVLVVVISAP